MTQKVYQRSPDGTAQEGNQGPIGFIVGFIMNNALFLWGLAFFFFFLMSAHTYYKSANDRPN